MARKKKKNGEGAKRIIILLVLAAIVVGGFAMLALRNKPSHATPSTLTPVEEVLARNLDNNYPATPKELLDEELIAQQTDDDYYKMLKADIDIFKSHDRSISSYSVSSAADIDYYKYEGLDWAKALCVFTVREGTSLVATQEEFLLRKDVSGHWKIFGWRIYDEKNYE